MKFTINFQINFQIRTIKHQIKATLKLIADGIKSYIDQLIVLEGNLEKLNQQLNKETKTSTPKIHKFQVGSVYTTPNHKEFSIKITRRTDKTVWYENLFNGEVGSFCCIGKKRVEVNYGRETVIDGLCTYEAGIASYVQ